MNNFARLTAYVTVTTINTYYVNGIIYVWKNSNRGEE